MKPIKDWHTSDGVLITDGLRVFTNNCEWGTVNFGATLGLASEYFTGWFNVSRDGVALGVFNGERLTTRPHPSLTTPGS